MHVYVDEDEEMLAGFGGRVRQRMESLGMSQHDLAIEIGTAPCAISMYLTGRRIPSVRVMLRIARALKAPIAWLIQGGDDK